MVFSVRVNHFCSRRVDSGATFTRWPHLSKARGGTALNVLQRVTTGEILWPTDSLHDSDSHAFFIENMRRILKLLHGVMYRRSRDPDSSVRREARSDHGAYRIRWTTDTPCVMRHGLVGTGRLDVVCGDAERSRRHVFSIRPFTRRVVCRVQVIRLTCGQSIKRRMGKRRKRSLLWFVPDKCAT